jgi:25S rRNA (cytosine2870-C5)-methyltransferase
VTGKNIESRSRALDKQAVVDAALDEEEMQKNAAAVDGEEDIDIFELPTADQREEEKRRGGPGVQEVQRRMQECAKVLGNFKRFGGKGR